MFNKNLCYKNNKTNLLVYIFKTKLKPKCIKWINQVLATFTGGVDFTRFLLPVNPGL